MKGEKKKGGKKLTIKRHESLGTSYFWPGVEDSGEDHILFKGKGRGGRCSVVTDRV